MTPPVAMILMYVWVFSFLRPPPMDGANSRSHEAIHQHSHSPPTSSQFPPSSSSHTHNGSAGSDVNAPSSASGYTRPRLGSHGNSLVSSTHAGTGTGKGSSVSSQYHSNSPSHIPGPSSAVSGVTSPSHSVSQYPHARTTPPNSGRTPPPRRANYDRSDGYTPRHAKSAHSKFIMMMSLHP